MLYVLHENAQLCIDHEPDTEVTCYVTWDIRAFGKGYEEFTKPSQEKYGIEFSEVNPASNLRNDDLTLTIREQKTLLLGKVTEYTYDLVVLSVGLNTLKVQKNSDKL